MISVVACNLNFRNLIMYNFLLEMKAVVFLPITVLTAKSVFRTICYP